MKLHIKTEHQPFQATPQVLSINYKGNHYTFQLLHATLQQRFPGKNWCQFREHAHDVYHIVLYHEGEDELLLGKERYKVGAGSLALIAPGDWHDVATLRKVGIVYSEVTFAFLNEEGLPLRLPFSALIAEISGLSLKSIPIPVRLGNAQAKELQAAFIDLLSYLDGVHPLAAMEAQRCILGILAFLARECYAPQRPESPSQNRLEEAKRYIERHYREKIAIERLADETGYSKGHFQRAFKREFEISPIAYQQHIRIQAAQTLLRYTEYACKIVAQRVGYDDVYAFSKTFKKLTGLSPTSYRKGFEGQFR